MIISKCVNSFHILALSHHQNLKDIHAFPHPSIISTSRTPESVIVYTIPVVRRFRRVIARASAHAIFFLLFFIITFLLYRSESHAARPALSRTLSKAKKNAIVRASYTSYTV